MRRCLTALYLLALCCALTACKASSPSTVMLSPAVSVGSAAAVSSQTVAVALPSQTITSQAALHGSSSKEGTTSSQIKAQSTSVPVASAAVKPAASAVSSIPAVSSPAKPAVASAAPATMVQVSLSITDDTGKKLLDNTVTCKAGSTVFDVTKDLCNTHKLPLDYSGSGAFVYIKGIASLYEFDKGPQSGWVYTVNGTKNNIGCGAYKLSQGDQIQWTYITKMD